MSTYRSLRPDLGTFPHVQCCAYPDPEGHNTPIHRTERVMQVQRQRAHGYDPERCQKRARYEIDGDPYCTLHAGQIALKEMLSRQATDT